MLVWYNLELDNICFKFRGLIQRWADRCVRIMFVSEFEVFGHVRVRSHDFVHVRVRSSLVGLTITGFAVFFWNIYYVFLRNFELNFSICVLVFIGLNAFDTFWFMKFIWRWRVLYGFCDGWRWITLLGFNFLFWWYWIWFDDTWWWFNNSSWFRSFWWQNGKW